MIKLNKTNLIVGIILIIINVLWTSNFAYFFFAYRLKNVLWLVMYPDWVLIVNILIGIIGIVLGVLLMKNQLKLRTCLLIDIPILILGFFLAYGSII